MEGKQVYARMPIPMCTRARTPLCVHAKVRKHARMPQYKGQCITRPLVLHARMQMRNSGKEQGTRHRVQCLTERARRRACRRAHRGTTLQDRRHASRHHRLAPVQENANARVKSLRHQVFPGGPPSKYYPGPTMLNFRDQTRTGVFIVVWS